MGVELILESLNVHSNFQQADADLLGGEAGVSKIHRQFSKTPFKFKFVISSIDGVIHTLSRRKDELMEKYGDPNTILIGYSHNVTSRLNYRPMNAWTLAHRIAHVIQANYLGLPDNIQYDVFRPFGELAEAWTNGEVMMDGMGKSWVGPFVPLSSVNTLLRFLMTQKSARDNNITSELDLLGELIAQFVITGFVKLLGPEGWDARMELVKKPPINSTEFQDSESLKSGALILAGLQNEREFYGDEVVADRIKKCEQLVNQAIENLLLSLCGQCRTF